LFLHELVKPNVRSDIIQIVLEEHANIAKRYLSKPPQRRHELEEVQVVNHLFGTLVRLTRLYSLLELGVPWRLVIKDVSSLLVMLLLIELLVEGHQPLRPTAVRVSPIGDYRYDAADDGNAEERGLQDVKDVVHR
jgi:hypothetical protein